MLKMVRFKRAFSLFFLSFYPPPCWDLGIVTGLRPGLGAGRKEVYGGGNQIEVGGENSAGFDTD